MRCWVVSVLLFVFTNSSLTKALACAYRSAHLSGKVTHLVTLEGNLTCIGFVRFKSFNPTEFCGFNPDLIELHGLPVSCETRIGDVVTGMAYYYESEDQIYFNGLWMSIQRPDDRYTPNWPW